MQHAHNGTVLKAGGEVKHQDGEGRLKDEHDPLLKHEAGGHLLAQPHDLSVEEGLKVVLRDKSITITTA